MSANLDCGRTSVGLVEILLLAIIPQMGLDKYQPIGASGGTHLVQMLPKLNSSSLDDYYVF